MANRDYRIEPVYGDPAPKFVSQLCPRCGEGRIINPAWLVAQRMRVGASLDELADTTGMAVSSLKVIEQGFRATRPEVRQAYEALTGDTMPDTTSLGKLTIRQFYAALAMMGDMANASLRVDTKTLPGRARFYLMAADALLEAERKEKPADD